MNSVEGITAVVVSDREGLIITSQSKGEAGDDSILGAIAATIDTFIDRMKGEFSEETNFFNITTIGDQKFTYCSMGLNSILLTISKLTTPENELRVYSEHIAGKVELLLEGNEEVSLEIPAIIGVLAKTKDGKIPTGDFPIKLILIGDYNVGKTSLIMRFVENSFKDSYHSTIGVEISQKSLNLSESTKISFVIWDIGGQITQMAPYRKRFYSGANSAFLVIDRTRPNILASVERWYNEIKKYVSSTMQIILIGNKSDLADEIIVREDQLKYIADQFGFNYILTSAKTGENVVDSFLYIAYKYLESV
jgi:small GTP-binding protein